MALEKIRLGSVEVSRLALGGNMFSGFSHQGDARDREMRKYYTVANIKAALRKAEAAGINTFFGRTDNHVVRTLEEYWDEGGKIQWIAQTASEISDFTRAINTAGEHGAKGCYLHGGQTDYFFHQKQFDNFFKALDKMRSLNLVAGFAGHRPEAHQWLRDNVKADFQMCSYYDPQVRQSSPDHVARDDEKFDAADRDAMARTITTISRPVVHYKVLAGGRNPVDEAFKYVAGIYKPTDVVIVGIYLGDDEEMIAKTVAAFEKHVQRKG